MEDPQFIRLSDGKLSCRYKDEEFFILSAKGDCSADEIKMMTLKLMDILDKEKEDAIIETLDQEAIKLNKAISDYNW
jgi:hypothetical protein